MKNIKERCSKTTKHISNKILSLRRAHNLTQEQFAEKVNLDRRTIARAEDGIHRPSAETIEIISENFDIPVSYFYDNTVYRPDISKTALIHEINIRLNVLSKNELKKVKYFIDIID